jgi:hypothetical protein
MKTINGCQSEKIQLTKCKEVIEELVLGPASRYNPESLDEEFLLWRFHWQL